MTRRVLVVGCGALVRELRTVIAGLNDVSVTLEVLPSPLHNRPQQIPGAVEAVLTARRTEFDHVLIGYADCGTGGLLDALIERVNATAGPSVVRLPGSHCYEFFAGTATFEALHAEELGTFFLTDYLARHADALVFGGLGLDRHPELRDIYFANYHRLVHLSQVDDPSLVETARQIADRLGLRFEHRHTGLDPFAGSVGSRIGEPGPGHDEPDRHRAQRSGCA